MPINPDSVIGAIEAGFKKTDASINEVCKLNYWADGSTVACAVVLGNMLFVGNLGDTEIVLACNTKPVFPPSGTAAAAPVRCDCEAICLTQKHLATEEPEALRVKQAGGRILFGRVEGSLAVSRAFGDLDYKTPKNRLLVDTVTSIPFVVHVELTPDNQFMIIACDGMWDRVTYREAVTLCSEAFRNGKSPRDAAALLVATALERRTLDNVSCIVVRFKW